MSRPEASSQIERAMVVQTVLDHWCSGDFKGLLSLYSEEEGDPSYWDLDITPQQFVEKWGEYIELASNDLDDLVGVDLFGDEWD